MDERTAIQKVKQGDWTGLQLLVENYQVRAVQSAMWILRDRDLAEEAAQCAFIRLAERISQYDETRPFSPWFFRIVVNEALKQARLQRRYSSLDDNDDEAQNLTEWLIDPQLRPDQLAEMEESRSLIRAAMDRLAPQQRAVIVMRYFLEMSEAEISSAVDRPSSTVKWWLRAAREHLRHWLRSANV